MITANTIFGFLTIVLAMFSSSILSPFIQSGFLTSLEGWLQWYVLFAYGYYAIIVFTAGVIIGTFHLMQRRWAWKANLIFQVITVGVLISTVVVFGLGIEFNSGLNTRNFSLILSSLILALLVMANRRSTQRSLNRATQYLNDHNVGMVSVIAIFLIVAFWIGLFDPLLSYSHITYGSMTNPLDKDEELYVYVKQTSPTLAANTLATIEVAVNMNYTYRTNQNLSATHNQPDSFWLIFDDSECGTLIQPGEVCVKTIPRIHENYYFGSFYPITYGRDGDYHITLAVNLGQSDSRSTTENPVIHVSPTEATNAYRTFKMSIIIGIIAGAIGFITLFIQMDISRKSQ